MSGFSRRALVVGMSVGVLGLVGMQLVPVDRTNPPVETEVPAPGDVRGVLRRACYDCHSNETRWPWHSTFAPMSWLIAVDVREGREEINYSEWNRIRPDKRAKAVEESWDVVEDGEMPPLRYLLMHPEARLSAEDKAVLEEWGGE